MGDGRDGRRQPERKGTSNSRLRLEGGAREDARRSSRRRRVLRCSILLQHRRGDRLRSGAVLQPAAGRGPASRASLGERRRRDCPGRGPGRAEAAAPGNSPGASRRRPAKDATKTPAEATPPPRPSGEARPGPMPRSRGEATSGRCPPSADAPGAVRTQVQVAGTDPSASSDARTASSTPCRHGSSERSGRMFPPTRPIRGRSTFRDTI